jgi:hypothetical protein
MMVLGDSTVLPPAALITADGRRFKVQQTDPKDPQNVTGIMIPQMMSWILSADTTGQPAEGEGSPGRVIGYFRLGASSGNPISALKMSDLRIRALLHRMSLRLTRLTLETH